MAVNMYNLPAMYDPCSRFALLPKIVVAVTIPVLDVAPDQEGALIVLTWRNRRYDLTQFSPYLVMPKIIAPKFIKISWYPWM